MSSLFKIKLLLELGSLAAVTLLVPSLALAGGKATMVTSSALTQMEEQKLGSESATLTMTWQDTNTIRMDFGDSSHYLLMRDGKAYSVTQSEGETQVMDMAGMSAMIKAMSGKNANNDNPFGRIDSTKATGASETIAGIKGQVYQMTWTDPDGSQQSGDAVLTNDPLVMEMTEAYLNAMGSMIGAEYTRSYQDALPADERGLLQVGDQFQVESIEQADPPASTFELPAEPMDLQSLLKGLGQ